MSDVPAGPPQKCASCEADRSHGEYVHSVWFCTQCLLRMCRSDKNQYIRDVEFWKKEATDAARRANEYSVEIATHQRLGRALVTAVEGIVQITARSGKSRLANALRELREYLCRR